MNNSEKKNDAAHTMKQNLAMIKVLTANAANFKRLLGPDYIFLHDRLTRLLGQLKDARDEQAVNRIVEEILRLIQKTPLVYPVIEAMDRDKPKTYRGIPGMERGGTGTSRTGSAGPGAADVSQAANELYQTLQQEAGLESFEPEMSGEPEPSRGQKAVPPDNGTRYLNTLFTPPGSAESIPLDQPLLVDHYYDLYIEISPQQRGPGLDNPPFPMQALAQVFQDASSITLDVWVSSRDFQVEPQLTSLELPRQNDPCGVRVQVIRKGKLGPARLRVEIFYRGHLLQSKLVEALVAAALPLPGATVKQPAQSAQITFTTNERLTPENLMQLPERVLTINVEQDAQGGNLDLRILDRTAGRETPTVMESSMQPDGLGKAIQDLRRKLEWMTTNNREGQQVGGYKWLLEADGATLNAWLPLLADNGHRLYRELFMAGEEPTGFTAKPGTVIQVNPIYGLTTVPWALLYERPVTYIEGQTHLCPDFETCSPDCPTCAAETDPYVVCPYHFWGYRYAIEQIPCWVNSELPELPLLVRQVKNARPLLLDFNVYRNFQQWHDHCDKLKAAGSVDIRCAESFTELQGLWDQYGAQFDIVYFYTHGGVDPVIDEYLEVSDKRIGSTFVQQAYGKWQHGPLVLLIGCSTGAYGPGSYTSLIQDFRRAGASGIIASECSVPEMFAEAFFAGLLPRVFRGDRLGQAMLQLRVEFLREKHNPMGLIYALYGTNEVALVQPVA